MSHLDDESIAAAANGELLADADSTHLRECAECSRRVRALDDLILQATTAGRPQPLLVPPARVWDAIVAEIAAGDEGVESRGSAVATVTPIRRFAPLRLIAAAAAGVVIGGVGVGWWDGRSADDFTVVASAELTSLTTDVPAGEAHVEAREGGERVLVLDTDLPSERSGDLEVWLIDPSVTGMVSLGFLESSHGEFVIPQGYSISAYPIVDISVEPRDGVPTHSGDSITRGTLGA